MLTETPMMQQAERRKTRYALVGVAALAALLICVGVVSAQRPLTNSVGHHEQLTQLDLTDDAPKPPGPPRKLSRKARCNLAVRGLARRLTRMSINCARLGPKPVNKKKCIRAIKRAIAFPFLHVIDEPKEFARSRRPVSVVFDCAEDLYKFAMGKPVGKPKKKIRITWAFGPKPMRVLASACTPKGVSAFLQPPTPEPVKMQGKKIVIPRKDTVIKIDARRVKRRLKVSKFLITGIFDLSRVKKPPMEIVGDEENNENSEMDDEEDDEDDEDDADE